MVSSPVAPMVTAYACCDVAVTAVMDESIAPSRLVDQLAKIRYRAELINSSLHRCCSRLVGQMLPGVRRMPLLCALLSSPPD